MKKTKLASLILFALMGCTPKVDFLVLSNKIDHLKINDGRTQNEKIIKLGKKARSKAYLSDSVLFIRQPIRDSLFIIEGYNYTSGVLFGDIFDKTHKVSYRFSKGELQFGGTSLTKFQMEIVKKWDTTMIKHEEGTHGLIDNQLIYKAMRCYKKNNDWQIDTISFEDFFDFKRDNRR